MQRVDGSRGQAVRNERAATAVSVRQARVTLIVPRQGEFRLDDVSRGDPVRKAEFELLSVAPEQQLPASLAGWGCIRLG